LAKKAKKTASKEMRLQIKGILLLALAAFSYLGLYHTDQAGGAGLYVNTALRSMAGTAALIIPVIIALFSLHLLWPKSRKQYKGRIVALLILPLLYMTWIHLDLLKTTLTNTIPANIFFEGLTLGLAGEGGGMLGAIFSGGLFYLLGLTGSRILLVALALIAVLVVFNVSIKKIIKALFSILEAFSTLWKKALGALKSLINSLATDARGEQAPQEGEMDEISISAAEYRQQSLEERNNNAAEANESGPEEHKEKKDELSEYQKERLLQKTEALEAAAAGDITPEPLPKQSRQPKLSDYQMPPLRLLSLPRQNGDQHVKSSRSQARLLENTLLSFGVKARVVHVQSGPTVTRFEVQPEAGVKVSRILSLSDDLALNLAAPLVRIEAPIPGKAALGIEVPNKIIALVHIREVMEDNSFQKSPSPLTIGLGKDITGNPIIADLTKMPHLLIAGATGAGKSVCLNTIITSMLYKADPDQVRLMMIDPKVVELSIYNGIPHLLMPVLTDPRKSALALKNMVREMGRRYELFADLGVRDISAYNEMAAKENELEKLSFIVIIIDELADLMLVSPGEVEDAIARLAQMSRAAGIHLVVATQRPSVDVLTGIIKANITSRVAFTVSSQVDSRTILDMAGAEKLLGSGDMLFSPVGAVKPFRVQGAYVSEGEIKRITDFIKAQGQVEYDQDNNFLAIPDEKEEEALDALFAEAVDLVVRTGQASISLLQRRFRIGYTRAARLIDDLEKRGVVGPFEGSKPRDVLITEEQSAHLCEEFKKNNH
jgi:DNA segregation ATPase FtsK/SpoIIIE, S-DNA-T family